MGWAPDEEKKCLVCSCNPLSSSPVLWAAGPWQAAVALGEALGTFPAATLSAPASSQHEPGLPGCSFQEQEMGLRQSH